MKSLKHFRDKNEFLFCIFLTNEILICALILSHWLLMKYRFWKSITCCVPAFLFVPVSVWKLFVSPQERGCRYGHWCGEVIVVVKETNVDDRTVKIFLGSALKSAKHVCNQTALPSTETINVKVI